MIHVFSFILYINSVLGNDRGFPRLYALNNVRSPSELMTDIGLIKAPGNKRHLNIFSITALNHGIFIVPGGENYRYDISS